MFDIKHFDFTVYSNGKALFWFHQKNNVQIPALKGTEHLMKLPDSLKMVERATHIDLIGN